VATSESPELQTKTPSIERWGWTLRVLAKNYRPLDRESELLNLHRITKLLELQLHKTLRGPDVKECLLWLCNRGWVEMKELESGDFYRITEKGYRFYEDKAEEFFTAWLFSG